MRRGALACSGAAADARSRRLHGPAFLGAAFASMRAFLAVRHGVTRAFIAAGVANLCAQSADVAGKAAAACHIGCSKTADVGAVDVERDASGHGRYVIFLQALRCAHVACFGASLACFDTGLKLFPDHDRPPLHSRVDVRRRNRRLVRSVTSIAYERRPDFATSRAQSRNARAAGVACRMSRNASPTRRLIAGLSGTATTPG